MKVPISEVLIAQLRQAMLGDVLTKNDAAYDEARKIWNGDLDRRPALIARCKNVGDIKAAVAFARAHGLQLCIRAGGHSFQGFSMVDNALVIDLRALKKIRVDPATRRAVVQAGATLLDLDAATQAHGLAVTGGHVTHTGVAGLTLGGGVGHLMRKLGLTIDSLLSAQIVTADGRVLRASPTENDDLFWGLRGGGGNFGVVTEFEFQLAPLGPTVFGGLAFWASDKGPELMRRYRDYCNSAPDEITTVLGYMYVPRDGLLTPGYTLMAVGTDLTIAERSVQELRSFGPPIFDTFGPMQYVAVQQMLDSGLAYGTKVYAKSHYLYELSDEAIEKIHAETAKMPVSRSLLSLVQMGGAVARVSEDATAFGGRSAAFTIGFLGIWEEEAEKPNAVQWVRSFWNETRPFARGAYVNISDAQDQTMLKVTYGADKYARLQKIKTKYDPDNVFHYNQNIKPVR